MAVFEYENEIIASGRGEILTQGEFYTFDSKYSGTSISELDKHNPSK